MTDWLYEASNAQAQLEGCNSRLNRVAAIISDIEAMISDPGQLTDVQGRSVAAVSKSKLLEMLSEAKRVAQG